MSTAEATANEVVENVESEANGEEQKKKRGPRPRFDFAKDKGLTEGSLSSEDPVVAEWFDYRTKSRKDSNLPAPLAIDDKFFKNVVESSRYRLTFVKTRIAEEQVKFEESLVGLRAKESELSTIIEKADSIGTEKAIKYAAAKKEIAKVRALVAALEADEVDCSEILEDLETESESEE